MTQSEIEFKLNNLPPNTPITAEYMLAIIGISQATGKTTNQHSSYSNWDKDKLIDTDTLSEWIGEVPNRLKQWRFDGVGPKFIKGSKHVKYRVGDVRDWLKSKTVQTQIQDKN